MTLWVFLGDDDVVNTGVIKGSDNYDAKVGDTAVVFSERNGLIFGQFRIKSLVDSNSSDGLGGESGLSFRVEPLGTVFQAEIEHSVY